MIQIKNRRRDCGRQKLVVLAGQADASPPTLGQVAPVEALAYDARLGEWSACCGAIRRQRDSQRPHELSICRFSLGGRSRDGWPLDGHQPAIDAGLARCR